LKNGPGGVGFGGVYESRGRACGDCRTEQRALAQRATCRRRLRGDGVGAHRRWRDAPDQPRPPARDGAAARLSHPRSGKDELSSLCASDSED